MVCIGGVNGLEQRCIGAVREVKAKAIGIFKGIVAGKPTVKAKVGVRISTQIHRWAKQRSASKIHIGIFGVGVAAVAGYVAGSAGFALYIIIGSHNPLV